VIRKKERSKITKLYIPHVETRELDVSGVRVLVGTSVTV